MSWGTTAAFPILPETLIRHPPPRLTYLGAQLIEDGRQLLAVAAPGRVELDQRVLAVVGDHVVEVLADSHRDGSVVRLRHRLRLQVRLQLAGLARRNGRSGLPAVTSPY